MNTDWTHPHAVAHLAHKAEHAATSVTLHGADVGDTTTIISPRPSRSKTRRPTLTIRRLWTRSSVIRGITATGPHPRHLQVAVGTSASLADLAGRETAGLYRTPRPNTIAPTSRPPAAAVGDDCPDARRLASSFWPPISCGAMGAAFAASGSPITRPRVQSLHRRAATGLTAPGVLRWTGASFLAYVEQILGRRPVTW